MLIDLRKGGGKYVLQDVMELEEGGEEEDDAEGIQHKKCVKSEINSFSVC